MIGKRSLGLVSLLDPLNASRNPGCVPFTHSSFLVGNTALKKLRAPLHRSPLASAMPLQTSSGDPSFMRAVQGASCLHSCGRVAQRQAFGINLFLVFASHLCMWCWHRDWKYCCASINFFLYALASTATLCSMSSFLITGFLLCEIASLRI